MLPTWVDTVGWKSFETWNVTSAVLVDGSVGPNRSWLGELSFWALETL